MELSAQSDGDDRDRIRSEIDSLRRLADRGDSIAIAGGKVCAWWGFVIALGCLLNAFQFSGWLSKQIPIGILMVVFGYVGTLALSRLGSKSRFLQTWRTQAISTAWLFAGIGVITLGVGAQLSGTASNAETLAGISIIFGIVLAVMATSSRKSILLICAFGWIGSGFLDFFLQAQLRPVAFGLAAIAFLFIPGLYLSALESRALK